MESNPWALIGMLLVAAMTFYVGHRSSRFANSTHDFLVARRTVRSRRNAAAISGEYLSAASFLGVAGIVLKEGVDALWYPIGFTAGYLALMLFVAAPLRRSGAYTLPDFLEARLGSVTLRKVATMFVCIIGILYMVPQLQAAGLALTTLMPAPAWLGAVVVTGIVMVNVIAGGMRAVTVVQALQYWLKLFALAAPTFVLCAVFFVARPDGSAGELGAPTAPTFPEETSVSIHTNVGLTVGSETLVRDGDQQMVWVPGDVYRVSAGTTLRFPAGAPVPVVSGATEDNPSWLRPASGGAEDLLSTYSVIFATFLGTMGLPHVLVRFYTNPDGKAARRTTVHVLLLLGLFYLFPTLLGALSRMYVPELLVTGRTDAAVLLLPSAMLPGLAGQVLGAVAAAGAFAAFLSTSSGLLVSVAGVVSTDVLHGRVRDFRVAAALVALIPMGLAVGLHTEDLSLSVGLSFALAASTFCPQLLLGIWWRRLTWAGAMAGMIAGGTLVVIALVGNTVSKYTGNWAPWFVEQPALITVPVAFLVTVLVSLGTSRGMPGDLNAVMLRLHAPDPLGFMRDRAVARFGRAEERVRLSRGRHRK
ncbi:Sodium:solute symporter family protein [Amycolatopsis arida]|uniref:Sodium:solute symporter family protein n=1 Tax=Amycolatopsis arida TaxID=587909 RepID=A0A1I5YNU3_9PSEU|nr:cation acetate symporter [Amycolatopsis arida]TDX90653.1 sodium:solute symporter family protein [Amycolatopsis arida]SFQ45898.1 Sodium:solute symporter family protein [Amycolatopsis arida]